MLFRVLLLRAHWLAAPALLALTLTSAACPPAAGDDDDDDDDDGGEGEGEPAELLADAAIAYADRCGLFGDPEGFGFQAEPLLFDAIFAPVLDSFRDALLADFNSEAVVLNAAAVSDCIAAIEAAPCDDELPDNDACEEAVQGTLAEGEACGSNTECGAEGLSCFKAADDECGTCETEAAEGEGCGTRNCADDLDCVGAICVVEEEVAPLEVGDLCDPDGEECDLFDTGLACVDTGGGTSECAPAVVVQVGDDCDSGSRQRYCENSASSNFCVDDGTGAGTGTCTARPGAGEECLLTVLCDATEAVCIDGTCELGGEAGDDCDVENPVSCQVGLSCGDDETCGPLFLPEPPADCIE